MIVYEDAVSEIFSVVQTAVRTGASTIIGYEPVIYWPGDIEPGIPDDSKFWLRVRQMTVLEHQSSLRVDTKRYTSHGVLWTQVFCPKRPDTILKGRKLARLIRDSYRTSSGGSVTYRNHRLREETPEIAIQQFAVIVDYEFDEEL